MQNQPRRPQGTNPPCGQRLAQKLWAQTVLQRSRGQEVKQSNLRQKIDVDFACWSHAMFNSHTDFDNYHALIGEACDYVAMKSEMLSSVSTSSNAAAWFDFDFDLSWLEFPDIDLSLFDFLDF
jgi:hypothetical protein